MKKPSKGTLAIGAIIVLGFAAAAAAFAFKRRIDSVETLPARTGDLVEAVYGLGTVTANQSFQLKIAVTATIRQIHVREGDVVKAGAPLLRLDDGAAFTAPFAGTITSLPYKVGETVFPQLPMLTLMNLKDRFIAVSLEQEGALRVRPGQGARISFETLRGQSFNGKVRTLFPGTSQFLVHIDVPELPAEVLPGMAGDVAIEVASRENVLMVPIAAVQSGRILVKTGKIPKKVQVTLGAVDGSWGEVLSGDVHAGDPVIVPSRSASGEN